MKILLCDKLVDEGIAILKAVSEFQVDCQYGLTQEDLKKAVKDYDALIVRSMTQVTPEIIEAADRLKYIGRAGAGLDNVDLKAAARKGIVVMNSPGGNTIATAEQTMSLILALARNIPQAHMSLRSGKWERAEFKGVELYGKTLGVIGLGRIGITVAKICKAFGMKIIGYDPHVSSEKLDKQGIQRAAFEEVLTQADFITLHVPKTPETTDLITGKEIDLMKPTARLINCARGGIVNEMDLAKALHDGKIAGAALDVYEKEPPDPGHPLFSCENCITSPHLGAFTSEAKVNVAIEIAEIIRDALLGKGTANARHEVNL